MTIHVKKIQFAVCQLSDSGNSRSLEARAVSHKAALLYFREIAKPIFSVGEQAVSQNAIVHFAKDKAKPILSMRLKKQEITVDRYCYRRVILAGITLFLSRESRY